MQETVSFIKLIENRIKVGWNNPSICDYGEKAYTYGDVAKSIAQLHIIYSKAGIAKGDKIAMCGSNSSRWGIVFISALTYGAVPVPVLPDFQSDQIQNIVNHSDAELMFGTQSIYDRLHLKEMPHIKAFFNLENFSLIQSDSADLQSAMEKLDSLFTEKYSAGFTPSDVIYSAEKSQDDMAMLNYTSGTSGFSKGVMIPFRALYNNYFFSISTLPNGNMLSFLPMAHMYGLMFEFIFPFIAGNNVSILTRKPSPVMLKKALMDVQPSILFVVPLIVEKIVKKNILPKFSGKRVVKYVKWPVIGSILGRVIRRKMMEEFGGKVTEVIVGGAAINSSIDEFLYNIGFPLANGYGATECAPLISYEKWKRRAKGSCGKAIQNMKVKINSTDPLHVIGEILVSGPNVMLGYYKDEEATRETVDSQGWYHTGDLGLLDKKGNLFIKGRIKNMILGPSGQNIYPEEIEDLINSMLMVSESVVVQRQGKLVALVYPDYEDAHSLGLTDEHVTNIMELNRVDINEIVPAYERISSFEIVNQEFEKTPKKSIKRYLYK